MRVLKADITTEISGQFIFNTYNPGVTYNERRNHMLVLSSDCFMFGSVFIENGPGTSYMSHVIASTLDATTHHEIYIAANPIFGPYALKEFPFQLVVGHCGSMHSRAVISIIVFNNKVGIVAPGPDVNKYYITDHGPSVGATGIECLGNYLDGIE